MKTIRTKFLRLIGKKYLVTPFGILVAPKAIILENDLTHEEIHVVQSKELAMLWAGITLIFAGYTWWWLPLLSPLIFYLWYGAEWLVRYFVHTIKWLIAGGKTEYEAWVVYRSISFEREAYANDHDPDYLDKRPLLNMIKYL